MSKREQRKRERLRYQAARELNPPCGPCHACCDVLLVDEPDIKKLPFTKCPHQNGRGCDLHDKPEQPELCKTYGCSYRRGAFGLRRQYRPDNLGIIVTHISKAVCRAVGVSCPVLKGYEFIPGAQQRPAYLRLVNLARTGEIVLLTTSIDPDRDGRVRLTCGQDVFPLLSPEAVNTLLRDEVTDDQMAACEQLNGKVAELYRSYAETEQRG